MLNANLYRNYRSRTFSEIFDTFDEFKEMYTTCGIETTIRYGAAGETGSNSLKNLYYLLMANYANSPIASSDESRFMYQTMSIIFQYGPTWEKRLEVQKQLRLSTEEELRGSKAIYNQALNPQDAPGTMSTTGIDYVNSQSVTHHVRNKLDSYAELLTLLDTDVTGQFLAKFKSLFIAFSPEVPLWYVTDRINTEEEEQ